MARLFSVLLAAPVLSLASTAQETRADEAGGAAPAPPRDAVLGPVDVDWLTSPAGWPARIEAVPGERALVLSNGLVRRRVDLALGGATAALDDERTDSSHLRAVRPAARVAVDGVALACGGPVGEGQYGAQTDLAFPPAPGELALDPDALQLVGVERGAPLERLVWRRARHASPFAAWPPRGVRLTLVYARPDGRADLPAGLRVFVHHELYDGVPVLAKHVEVRNAGAAPFVVDRVVSEELAVVPGASWVEARDGVPLPVPPLLHVESEFAMGGMSPRNGNRFGVRWLPDPGFETQVNYLRRTPCLLEVAPENQMLRTVRPGEMLAAPAAFLVVHDSEDATRRALTLARAYEVLAPWATENPLMMHVRSSDDASVRLAVEQAADVGFEVVILTFGSGFDMEDRSPENLARWKKLADFAHSKGVQLGGYTLLSSRRIQPEADMCVNPETGAPGGQTHGYCPALASGWGLRYLDTVRGFLAATGFDLIEHDGPYPGDVDAAARPPLQAGAADSRYVQWSLAADLYRWCRANGVYVNAPDWYFMVGASKTGMGYRETNWSLPRARQVLHARQNIFDGTRTKRPSMGWMFVPLTEYHGGGPAATVEPLDDHRGHYAAMLAANLGAGAQACYRGPRLYDSESTRALVKRWVDWYREHRLVLEAPIVHSASRRADGRDVDWLLHADARLEGHKAMLCVYRPGEATDEPLARVLSVDLTYAGLGGRHRIQADVADGTTRSVNPDPYGRVRIQVTIPAGEPMTWVAFR